MPDAILAALPCIAIAAATALVAAHFHRRRKSQDDSEKIAEPIDSMPHGISLGMCLGVAIG